MFLDVLDMLYDSLERIIQSLDVDLFTVGLVSISFWELVLGMFTTTIIFGFFLRERMGSGLGAFTNFNDYEEVQRNSAAREAKSAEREARRSSERAHRESYEYYRERRDRNSAYSKQYYEEHRKKK